MMNSVEPDIICRTKAVDLQYYIRMILAFHIRFRVHEKLYDFSRPS